MSSADVSITRRLIATVLLLEFLAALGIILAVTLHEQHVQGRALDANIRATANALLGAVQEGNGDNVQLDLHGVRLPMDSIYRVTEEHGRVLGAAGELPGLAAQPGAFEHVQRNGRSYRFFTLVGDRVIDPELNGGIHHHLTVVYGNSDERVWHEVLEAVRFVAVSTVALLGLTAMVLVWVVKKLLAPIRELAAAAEGVTSTTWSFEPPQSARKLVELRPLTTALEDTIARLRRAFEQQKRFTSDAAHELKTDLAIVKSSFQLLDLKRRTEEEYQRGISLGLGDLSRLEQTILRMLTLARLEQAGESNDQTFRVDEALHEALQQSQPLADLKEVAFVLAVPGPMVVPLSHRDALLLFSNVLINAVQHSVEGGTVELKFAAEPHRVQLTIRDHGEGVRDEEADLFFEPFYRADPSRSRKSGGTGLGLSICRAICQRVGGSIALTNHPQGGALVTITLPCL